MPDGRAPNGADGLHVADDFFDGADSMRRVFDERLGSRFGAPPERFVWDYWHVPGQYTYVRTIAEEFFPPEIYEPFIAELRRWGRETLGCTGIIRPWLSYYIDGCRQELHADVPHGPWAYVFSLTKWRERSFEGGETLLLSSNTLDFWRGYDRDRPAELMSFVELVEPEFNRLTVFDPRVPHGVRLVEGTREPLDSRVAVHGWFNDPGVVLADDVDPSLRPAYEAALAIVLYSLREIRDVDGLVAIRVEIGSSGKVESSRVVSSSLVATGGDAGAVERALTRLRESLAGASFPSAGEPTWAVLPLALPTRLGTA